VQAVKLELATIRGGAADQLGTLPRAREHRTACRRRTSQRRRAPGSTCAGHGRGRRRRSRATQTLAFDLQQGLRLRVTPVNPRRARVVETGSGAVSSSPTNSKADRRDHLTDSTYQ
jgi:hypothetical protein